MRFVVSSSLSAVDAVNRSGATALHQASARGHTRLVQQLLQLGADPNIRDLSRFTPLQLAQAKGHTEIEQVNDEDPDQRRHGGGMKLSRDVAVDASAGGRCR